MYVRRRLVVLVCVQSALRVATSSVLLDGHTWNWVIVGWEAPSMAVADAGTTDCDSVVVCAARWSHTASGLYHSCLPVVVGWVASLVIANSATASEHPHQTFHASLFLCVQLFFVY